MAHKPRDYRHISAWGRMLGSMQYYIDDQQALASKELAPLDAVYKGDGGWVRFVDVHPDTQDRVAKLVRA